LENVLGKFRKFGSRGLIYKKSYDKVTTKVTTKLRQNVASRTHAVIILIFN